MKTWVVMVLVGIAFSGGALIGCGEEETKWSCTCAAQCDGNTSSVTESVCSTPSEASKAVDEAVAQCSKDLDMKCTTAQCACQCIDTESSC
jgi:hypothetical protein